MLYLFGFGEIPISISGDPSQKNEWVHTIRALGPVTEAMRRLKTGDEIGVRGPFGTSWPLSKKGGSFLLIAGGLGLVPLRPAVLALAARRDLYKSITLLYGARTQEDLLFTKEMEQWKEQGIDVKISLDRADSEMARRCGLYHSIDQ